MIDPWQVAAVCIGAVVGVSSWVLRDQKNRIDEHAKQINEHGQQILRVDAGCVSSEVLQHQLGGMEHRLMEAITTQSRYVDGRAGRIEVQLDALNQRMNQERIG